MHLPLPGCVALHQNELWKHGADEAAADRSHGSHSEHIKLLKNFSNIVLNGVKIISVIMIYLNIVLDIKPSLLCINCIQV